MSRFVRPSAAMTASWLASRSTNSLPSTLSSSALRPSSHSSLRVPSPSTASPLFFVSVRTVVNDPKMPRPSASSPPSSLKSSRQSSPAQQVTNSKKTTWITGLPVVPNAREVLLSLYEETLRKVASYGPTAARESYNAHVTQLTAYRQTIVQLESEVEAIEAAVSCGQIEDLIEQAENEYDLVVAMNESIKPWEADSEGDEAFKEYHPSFGQQKSDFNTEPTPDEQKAFDEFGGGGGESKSAGGAQSASGAAAASGTQQPAAGGATAARA